MKYNVSWYYSILFGIIQYSLSWLFKADVQLRNHLSPNIASLVVVPLCASRAVAGYRHMWGRSFALGTCAIQKNVPRLDFGRRGKRFRVTAKPVIPEDVHARDGIAKRHQIRPLHGQPSVQRVSAATRRGTPERGGWVEGGRRCTRSSSQWFYESASGQVGGLVCNFTDEYVLPTSHAITFRDVIARCSMSVCTVKYFYNLDAML